MAMACLNLPALSPRLASGGGAAPGRCSVPASSVRLPRRCSWRVAAVAEDPPQAVQEQRRTEGSGEAGAEGAADASSKLVLVVGGTGGVGQLVVASLLSRNIKTRLLLRDPAKAVTLFGEQDESVFQTYKADTRNAADFDPQMFEGVTHVICTTGTTAFPSKRWDGDNTPERIDWDGIRNLVSAMPRTIKRLVLVSSIGVTKYNELPWSIMNLFGVLKYKKMGEEFVQNSGIPFTIIRLVVAEACIQALDIEFTEGQIYEISSVKGEGPGSDPEKWKELFRSAQSN
uniref:NAD(P)-binding domain-containing protein n=1 Tax=Leersia perrieri TaxID=77586 RepID=A0A0D9VU46_9ORYZ